MIEIRKPVPTSAVVIRPATGSELSNYEKSKLAGIENNAQKNKIESIKVNGKRLPINTDNKEVNINLGSLAFKDKVTSSDLSVEECFFIKCSLDDTVLGESF